jgi:predicted acyl esterase
MAIVLETLRPAPLDPSAEQVMVPMRDSVRLATDVYLPGRPGRLPAVLVRLPYDKCGRYTFMPACAPFFTERGYAFVVQDVRGKFRSEGETMPFVHEVDDGYDTLEWIVAQSWSDGRVGMFGDSYYGYTQWAAVASGHTALKAIVPRVTSADLRVLTKWWADDVVELYGADYLAHYWADPQIHFYEGDYSHRPLAEVFDEGFTAIGSRSASFDLMTHMDGPDGVGQYPAGHPFDRLKIPALHSVGWFDNILPFSMDDYTVLRGRSQTAGLQYLNADATDHENYHLGKVPVAPEDDHDTDDGALARMLPVYLGPGLAFFDVFLKGRGDAALIPVAEWFLGNDVWRRSPTWPPPGASELRLYLGAAERAASGPEGGALTAAAETGVGVARWVHDPDDLVPSTVLNPFAFLLEWPDEREVERAVDVLTFTGEPLTAPLDLAGPVTVRLTLGSSGPSMHVHVKLCDVDPDGTTHMLLRGQRLVRASGYGTPVEVALSHTGYRVQPGHRLRLHVASSDFPLYLWHPGTDENPWFAAEGRANQQTLTTGGSAPAYVSLTVLS